MWGLNTHLSPHLSRLPASIYLSRAAGLLDHLSIIPLVYLHWRFLFICTSLFQTASRNQILTKRSMRSDNLCRDKTIKIIFCFTFIGLVILRAWVVPSGALIILSTFPPISPCDVPPKEYFLSLFFALLHSTVVDRKWHQPSAVIPKMSKWMEQAYLM